MLALPPPAPPLASCPSWRDELRQKVCEKLGALPRREAELKCTSDTAKARERWRACPLMCGAPCLPSADLGPIPTFSCIDSKPEFCANKRRKSLLKGGSAIDFCYKGDTPLIKCEKTTRRHVVTAAEPCLRRIVPPSCLNASVQLSATRVPSLVWTRPRSIMGLSVSTQSSSITVPHGTRLQCVAA